MSFKNLLKEMLFHGHRLSLNFISFELPTKVFWLYNKYLWNHLMFMIFKYLRTKLYEGFFFSFKNYMMVPVVADTTTRNAAGVEPCVCLVQSHFALRKLNT